MRTTGRAGRQVELGGALLARNLGQPAAAKVLGSIPGSDLLFLEDDDARG